jgi:hypothetical protein
MTRLVLVLLLGASSLASAATDRFYRLYDLDPRLDARTRAAIAELTKQCSYSAFSRLGPRAEQVEGCNRAEGRLVSMGTAGASAALATLDDPKLPESARPRLYDVIARVGDLSVIDLLVRGLEREEAAGLGNPRHHERRLITGALTELTFVQLAGTPAIQWRAWRDAHREVTRESLAAEREAELTAHSGEADVAEIVHGAWLLGTHRAGQAGARRVLEALLLRTDLNATQRSRVRDALDTLPIASPRAIPTATVQAQVAE